MLEGSGAGTDTAFSLVKDTFGNNVREPRARRRRSQYASASATRARTCSPATAATTCWSAQAARSQELIGGDGDDTYYVGQSGDGVVESADQRRALDHHLHAWRENVERPGVDRHGGDHRQGQRRRQRPQRDPERGGECFYWPGAAVTTPTPASARGRHGHRGRRRRHGHGSHDRQLHAWEQREGLVLEGTRDGILDPAINGTGNSIANACSSATAPTTCSTAAAART